MPIFFKPTIVSLSYCFVGWFGVQSLPVLTSENMSGGRDRECSRGIFRVSNTGLPLSEMWVSSCVCIGNVTPVTASKNRSTAHKSSRNYSAICVTNYLSYIWSSKNYHESRTITLYITHSNLLVTNDKYVLHLFIMVWDLNGLFFPGINIENIKDLNTMGDETKKRDRIIQGIITYIN